MHFSTLLATVVILCYTASASPLLIVPQFAPNESIIINGTNILSMNETDAPTAVSTVEPRDRRPPPEEVCNTEAGSRYHHQKFCGEKATPEFFEKRFPLFEAEVRRLRKLYKYKGDADKAAKTACKSYKQNWKREYCEEGRDKRWWCCTVVWQDGGDEHSR